MAYYLLLAFIFIIGFLLRLVLSLSETSDEDVSWWLIQRQAGQKWINYKLKDSILGGIYGYPVLLHFIIAKFPKNYRIIAGRLFNILPDFIVALSLLFITNLIFPLDTNAPIIVSAAYLINPILLPMTSRMKTIKGRSFGSMLVFFYFVSYYIALSHPFGWIIVFGLAILTVLSSMFAFQTLVFFSFVFSLLSLSVLPFSVLVLALTLGYFMPFLKIKEPLDFYYNHKLWYIRNYKKGTTAAGRKNLKNLILLPYYFFSDPRKFGALIFSDLPLVIFILFLPEAIFLFIKYQLNFPIHSGFLFFSWQIFTSSVIVFLFINIRQLSFLGQAERYMEYSLPFLVILLAFSFQDTNNSKLYFLLLILFHLIIILSIYIVSNIDKLFSNQRKKKKSYNELINYLEGKEEIRILTIPTKLSFSLSYEFNSEKIQFYYRFGQYKGDIGFKIYETDTNGLFYKNGKYKPSFLVLRHSPILLKEKYNADYLIIETEYIKGLEKQWGNFLENSKLEFKNDNYLLLNLN